MPKISTFYLSEMYFSRLYNLIILTFWKHRKKDGVFLVDIVDACFFSSFLSILP